MAIDNTEANEVTLLDDDGNEHQFKIWRVIDVEDSRYALLVPKDEEDTEEAYIFRMDKDGEEDILVAVESEDEFNKVAEVLAMEEEDAD